MNDNHKPNRRIQSRRLRVSAVNKLLVEEPAQAIPLADETLYELRVHQIELEMQNEELRRIQVALETSYAHFVELYDFAPVGYLTLSNTGLIIEINLTGAKLLGIARKDILQRRFSQFVAEQDKNCWNHLSLSLLNDTETAIESFELRLRRPEGAAFHARFDYQQQAEVGASLVLRLAFADITSVKQAEILRITATAFESQESILIIDANQIILQANQTFTKITGYSAAEVIGQTPELLRSDRHDASFYAALWAEVGNTGAWRGELWSRRKNGEIYPGWVTITAVQVGDNSAKLHYVTTLTDITEQKAAAAEIEQLAFYDPLTHLPNRRLLKDRLQQALNFSARHKRQGALLFIDLDNFKTLNDTLGHNMGDLLLQQVAQRLVHSLRESDTAARLGGDEFVVMLEDLSDNAEAANLYVEIVGKKILAALDKPFLLNNHPYRCTSSIGATLFNGHTATEEDLLKHVDIAMYQAKLAGRNALCFFDEIMQALLTKRAALETDLRGALAQNQFKLYYQLQTTHEGQTIGAEVLIRWKHPLHGLLLPTEFIPLAEQTGLILPIGQWALDVACTQLKHWSQNPQTQHLQLSVNVSARQLHQTDYVAQIQAVLQKTAIVPHQLKLELTEGIVLYDVNDTITKMQALKALGVQLALDDFGTGYSSLSYLTQLPFDQIKIDQSFVNNIGIKPTDAVIVQTIISMANNLSMEVIAEGVETEAQRDFLVQHGCTLFQGYFFSEPVSLAEFEALLLK